MTTSTSRRQFQRPVVPDRLDLRDRPYTPPVAKAPPASANSLERLEHGRRTNILGIAKHYDAMLADLRADVRQRMASWSAPLAGSMSTTHGGFDDDDRALETVIKLIRKEPVAGVPTATGVDEAGHDSRGD